MPSRAPKPFMDYFYAKERGYEELLALMTPDSDRISFPVSDQDKYLESIGSRQVEQIPEESKWGVALRATKNDVTKTYFPGDIKSREAQILFTPRGDALLTRRTFDARYGCYAREVVLEPKDGDTAPVMLSSIFAPELTAPETLSDDDSWTWPTRKAREEFNVDNLKENFVVREIMSWHEIFMIACKDSMGAENIADKAVYWFREETHLLADIQGDEQIPSVVQRAVTIYSDKVMERIRSLKKRKASTMDTDIKSLSKALEKSVDSLKDIRSSARYYNERVDWFSIYRLESFEQEVGESSVKILRSDITKFMEDLDKLAKRARCLSDTCMMI